MQSSVQNPGWWFDSDKGNVIRVLNSAHLFVFPLKFFGNLFFPLTPGAEKKTPGGGVFWGSKQPTPNISGREFTDVQARLSGHNLRSHAPFYTTQKALGPDENGPPPTDSMMIRYI